MARLAATTLVLVLMALFVAACGGAGPTATPTIVNFPDENLEAAIREALGKPPGKEITAADLWELTELNAGGQDIADVTGIEYGVNLTVLDLGGNQITGDNQISDISPLRSLTGLTVLDLEGNQISDISPLRSLTNLTELHLVANQISDISPLAYLSNLTELYLIGNQISDISSLRSLTGLAVLALEGNQISDISSLAYLTSLTDLDLMGNQISDISPLLENSGLGEGDRVEIRNNNLDQWVGSEDRENYEKLRARGVGVSADW